MKSLRHHARLADRKGHHQDAGAEARTVERPRPGLTPRPPPRPAPPAAARGLFGFADPALEARYLRDRIPYRILNTRYTTLIVCVIWGSFALIDRFLVPEQTIATLEIRIAAMICGAILFALTFLLPPGRWIEPASLAFAFTNIALVFAVKLVIAPAADDLLRSSSLFMILTGASFVAVALSFREGVLCALLSAAAYIVMTLVLKPEPVPQFIYGLLFILSMGGISGFAAYALERSERRAWLQRGELARAEAEIRSLLHNVLPPAIAERKRAGQRLIADDYPAVTVLFADIVDFTQLSQRVRSQEVVDHLNTVFSRFDAIIARAGLEKIKTIGDCYMAAAGVPEPRPDHLPAAAGAALAMIAEARQCRRPDGEALQLRLGLHTGPVTAGVIGETKFLFDLWGDTVNTASRLEAQGAAGCIQVSEAVYLGLAGTFTFTGPQEVTLKGKGACRTYFLSGMTGGR